MEDKLGYTLVEIILAIAILGLVLVPILMFMTNSSGIITHADIRETAILIAQQRIETLKSEGYDAISIGTSSYKFGDVDFPDYDEKRYPDFKISQDVNLTTNSLKKIEITVSWNQKDIVLKSNIAKR